MASDFSRTLALLRREKRISQRAAAGELGISQALLSHYENGLREPGLGFVVRAAEYYGVSCDYLLGRSLSREGGAARPAQPQGEGQQHPQAAQSRRLVTDSAALLLEAAARSGSQRLLDELELYLSTVTYKLFRSLYGTNPHNPAQAFRTSAEHYDTLCDALLKLTELRIRAAAKGELADPADGETALPELSLASLPEQYPDLADSALQVLQTVSDAIDAFDCADGK